SADKSREDEAPLPTLPPEVMAVPTPEPGLRPEPVFVAAAPSVPVSAPAVEPVALPSAPVPVPEPVQEREPEGVIPSQGRAGDPSVPWQDPKGVYEAIWANMSPKHRAELTMLLIENNRRG
ncbi:plasmid partitioning protein, partial [Streptomyces sp. NPDC048551]